MEDNNLNTVYNIFQSMEYGPSAAGTASTAMSWLETHSPSLGLFIDGKFVQPAGRQIHTVTNFTGGTVCSIVLAEDVDVQASSSSAEAGFKTWNKLNCQRRAKILLKFASTLQKYSECVSELCDISQSPCSPAALVRLAHYYAGWAQLRDSLLPEWNPRGVIAVVVTDDCSFYSLWLKVIPALALGNAVIVVPGVKLVAPTLLLAQLLLEAGLPAGVLNVVTGDNSLGSRVAQNSRISYLTYSGSKKDGEAVAKQMAGWGTPVSLSLSVSSVCPFIIFETADIHSAVDGVIETAFKKNKEWQWLLCVQESVCDSVVEKLKLRMDGMKCIQLGDESHRSLVEVAVQEARQQGATLIQPCAPPPSGCVYPPTVLCNLAPSCSSVVSPPPGPLLPLLTFRSASEGVSLGNNSPHVQAASIWTEDLTLALETARSLHVGTVWVNSHSVMDPSLPQSGRRESGNCTDGGREGLYQFLRLSHSPTLPDSKPIAMDFAKFGAPASKFLVPECSEPTSVVRSSSHLIGGKPCKADSGCSRAVLSPGGSLLAYCPDGGRKDVRNAVESALKVQTGWMKKSPAARAQALFSLADSLEKRRKDLAASIHSQTGRSMEDAEEEVELSIIRLSNCAAFCDKQLGQIQTLSQTGSALCIPEALGIVGVVLPDTKPLLSLVSLLGAAVSLGNGVVMVPGEKYPLAAVDFIQVLQASDIPAGLVSIITGGRDQLTQALANHNEIQAIWYWGSMEGCQYLQHTCSSTLKRLWLHCEQEEEKQETTYWSHTSASAQEEMWRRAVVWKSVWIPTA